MTENTGTHMTYEERRSRGRPYVVSSQEADLLRFALRAITQIPNRLNGTDWEEIEDARLIAEAALAGNSSAMMDAFRSAKTHDAISAEAEATREATKERGWVE